MGENPPLSEVLTTLRRETIEAFRSASPSELAVVYLFVPALLIVAQAVPGSDAWTFSLAADGVLTNRWTVWTAFASSYVHSGPLHLLNNIAVFWMVLGVAYPLSIIAGWRRHLLFVGIVCLLVVPFVAAWTTLVTLGTITDVQSSGFSGINNAFLGYLLVVWFAAIERATGGSVTRFWALAAAPASLAVVLAVPTTVEYFPTVVSPAIGCGLIAVLVAGWLLASDRTPEPFTIGIGTEFVLVVGASVFTAGLIGSMLVVPGGSNVWAHLAGYLVGLAVTLPTIVAPVGFGTR